MTVTSPDASSDALLRLRINRNEEVRRRSFFGRLVRFLFLMVAVLVLMAAGAFFAQTNGWLPNMGRMLESVGPKPEVRVSIVSVETGRSSDATVVATGYVKSRQQARIGARATGRIQQINVEEGSKVKAQEVLAMLEHADLDASLAAVNAMAARARSELLEQDVEIQRTLRILERSRKAVAGKTIAAAEFDADEFQHQAAVARRTSLEAALDLAEARVREAEQLVENMFVRAPFAGTVISKDAELGESIMPGGMGEASGRGSVVTIADLDHLEVECDVKEDFISRVTVGQQTEVAVDAVPDRRYKGKVRKIIPMGDRARATVKVLAEILDADERLFPDMSSTVYYLSSMTEERNRNEKPRIFCQNDALHTEGSETFVWIVSSDDRLKKVIVEVGEEKEDRTEILKGLSGGEKVVVSLPKEFKEGMLVKTAQ